jgi:hypothetical protein
MKIRLKVQEILEEVIQTNLTFVETRLHILLTALKILMLQNLPIITKKQVTRLGRTNYVHIICQRRKNTSRVGCCNRMENVKMN